jgi:hypothetical protein
MAAGAHCRHHERRDFLPARTTKGALLMKKIILTTAAGLAVLAAPLAATAAPWGHGRDGGGWNQGGRDGGWRGGRDDGWRGRDNGGGALAAGLFGLFLGSAIASNNHPYYGYEERCGWTTQRYVDYWGDVQYRQVQVCR